MQRRQKDDQWNITHTALMWQHFFPILKGRLLKEIGKNMVFYQTPSDALSRVKTFGKVRVFWAIIISGVFPCQGLPHEMALRERAGMILLFFSR